MEFRNYEVSIVLGRTLEDDIGKSQIMSAAWREGEPFPCIPGGDGPPWSHQEMTTAETTDFPKATKLSDDLMWTLIVPNDDYIVHYIPMYMRCSYEINK